MIFESSIEGDLAPDAAYTFLRIAYSHVQKCLAVMISDLGGEVTIPAGAMTPPRMISTTYNPDGSITLRVQEEPPA